MSSDVQPKCRKSLSGCVSGPSPSLSRIKYSDVVIRGRFYVLDPLGVVEREIVDNAVQHVLHGRGNRPDFLDTGLVGQALKPTDFDQDAEANEAVFTENIAEVVE
jgi:hypothetical protein